MLQLCRKASTRPLALEEGRGEASLTLSFEDRRKSRLRTHLDDGREVGVLLPRGSILHEGDYLLDRDEKVLVAIKATVETLSVVRTADRQHLARAAYHLGNRHVPLQVGPDWLAYEHDHVLDDMVRALDLAVVVEQRPFEPEPGGYSHGHHEDPTGGMDSHEQHPDPREHHHER